MDDGVEVMPTRDYGVGIDCHSRFLEINVLAKRGPSFFEYCREVSTDWNAIRSAHEWGTHVIRTCSDPPVMLLEYFLSNLLRYSVRLTRVFQAEFLKARNKKKYRAEHGKELDLYNDAVRYFKENAGGTIPSIKDLKAEKERLSSLRERQKETKYGASKAPESQASAAKTCHREEEVNDLRQYEKELQIAVTNVDAILGPDRNQSREKPENTRPAQEQNRPAAVRRSRGKPSL